MDDFKGLRIRAPGGDAAVYAGLGATPVSDASYYQQYEFLQKGRIDVGAGSLTSVRTMKLEEQTKYIIPTDFWFGASCNYVNKDAWAAIPQWIKDIHWEVVEEMPAINAEFIVPAAEADMKYWVDYGMEVIEIDAAWRAQFVPAMIGAWKIKIEAEEKRGNPVREYMRDVLAFREKLTGEKWEGYQP